MNLRPKSNLWPQPLQADTINKTKNQKQAKVEAKVNKTRQAKRLCQARSFYLLLVFPFLCAIRKLKCLPTLQVQGAGQLKCPGSKGESRTNFTATFGWGSTRHVDTLPQIWRASAGRVSKGQTETKGEYLAHVPLSRGVYILPKFLYSLQVIVVCVRLKSCKYNLNMAK